MITMITGTPGAGKTAWMVEQVRRLALDGSRPVYVCFDPAWVRQPDQQFLHETLKLPHFPVHPEKWQDDAPDGALVVFDEAQESWRTRPAGSKVPVHIQALEKHRHRGLDFLLTTQGPQLLDSNLRALVGRHVHLRDVGVLGRWLYEWPECCDTARTTGWKTAPHKARYKLPKAAFELYRSASVHIKPTRTVPRVLVVVLMSLLVLVVLIWMGYRSISSKVSPTLPPSAVPLGAQPVAGARSSAAAAPVSAAPARVVADERVDFVPRIYNRPWTAPAYDQLRQVAVMPNITGSMCINDHCICYAGAAKLHEISSDACRTWTRDKPFNPYASATAQAPGQRAVDGKRSAAADL